MHQFVIIQNISLLIQQIPPFFMMTNNEVPITMVRKNLGSSYHNELTYPQACFYN